MGLGDFLSKVGNGIGNGLSKINPLKWGDESDSAVDKRNQLNAQAQSAGNFANTGESGYGQLGWEAALGRQQLRDVAEGRTSLVGEQMRQALAQQRAAQMSMAAGASPQNAAMAARTAAIQMGRAQAGTAGQAAMAAIAERMAAAKAYNDAVLAARDQDARVALGSRQTAISGYGGVTPEGSFIDKWGPAISAGASYLGSRGGKKG